MQDVRHMLHLHVAQQLPAITLRSWSSDLSPTNDKDAELSQQFPVSTDLKQNIARLTQVKNDGKETSHKIFTIYISKRSKGTVWQQIML